MSIYIEKTYLWNFKLTFTVNIFVLETLRLCNGNIVLIREATKQYQVPNDTLVIEKGQKIIIPINSIHNDPKYYPNPHIFDPERFSPAEKSKRPSGTELSFGDGPRLCLGILCLKFLFYILI